MSVNWLVIDLILGALIGYWMYNDAKKRKLENPILWIWVGVLLGILGLALYWYWYVRPGAKAGSNKKVSASKKS